MKNWPIEICNNEDLEKFRNKVEKEKLRHMKEWIGKEKDPMYRHDIVKYADYKTQDGEIIKVVCAPQTVLPKGI